MQIGKYVHGSVCIWYIICLFENAVIGLLSYTFVTRSFNVRWPFFEGYGNGLDISFKIPVNDSCSYHDLIIINAHQEIE